MAKKRSHGEGSVRRLKSGRWHGELMDGYLENGKKNIVSFSGETKGEVLEQIRDYQNKRDENVRLNRKLKFGSWADSWYEDYKSQVQPSTYSGYFYTLKLLKEHFGAHSLCDILPLHINRFQDELAERGYSASQIHKCRTMLIQIFDAADGNGLIMKNPARRSKIIRADRGVLPELAHPRDAFSDDEVEALFQKLDNDLLGHSIRLLLDTGVRVQELLALAPDDISEDGSSLNVNKAIKTVGGKPTLGPPKSLQGYRTVPIPEKSRASARYLRQHGGRAHIWSESGNNPYYSVGSFRRRYYNALKKVDGVRRLSPHCCRHTYVTRLQGKDVPLEIIARLVGHANISVTNTYAHTAQSTVAAMVDRLNQN